MSQEFRLTAGILPILISTVVFGGASILSMLVGDPAYAENVLSQGERTSCDTKGAARAERETYEC